MNCIKHLLVLVMFVAVLGCGSSTKLSTAPLTDEQLEQIRKDDQKIDNEESPNNKTLKSKGKRN